MTRKNILMILPIMFSMLFIPNIILVFADHPESSGAGGCSMDCTPPTLGKDSSGTIFVEGGFTINEQTSDVAYFDQVIQTQIVSENNPVEIILKVFENSGPDNLKHVELILGNEYVFDSFVWTHLPSVEIGWDKAFNGTESVNVKDPDNLLADVDVNVEVDGKITILKFKFTPTMQFDTSHIIVKMWDQNRSSWVNNFYDALVIESNSLDDVVMNNFTLSSESKTLDKTFGINEDTHNIHETVTMIKDIHCISGTDLVYRTSNGSPVCVTPYSASVLIEYGWAVPTP